MVHDEYDNCFDSALELNFDYDQALPRTEDTPLQNFSGMMQPQCSLWNYNCSPIQSEYISSPEVHLEPLYTSSNRSTPSSEVFSDLPETIASRTPSPVLLSINMSDIDAFSEVDGDDE